jgi:hypothetical protein
MLGTARFLLREVKSISSAPNLPAIRDLWMQLATAIAAATSREPTYATSMWPEKFFHPS